jgi:hypothetical protein
MKKKLRYFSFPLSPSEVAFIHQHLRAGINDSQRTKNIEVKCGGKGEGYIFLSL